MDVPPRGSGLLVKKSEDADVAEGQLLVVNLLVLVVDVDGLL